MNIAFIINGIIETITAAVVVIILMSGTVIILVLLFAVGFRYG